MTSIALSLQSLEIAAAQHYRGLAIYPLLQRGLMAEAPAYLTLDEALSRGVARVTEVNQSGSVPDLCFRNDGPDPVLLLGGEELVGAKQNRILNLTILVPGKTTLVVPVSCVEAGRWHENSPAFMASPHMMPRSMRAKVAEQVTNSMRMTGNRRANQQEVWSDIAAQASVLGAESPTSAMADSFQKAALSLDDFSRSFQWVERQAGMAYCIAGMEWGLDLFDHPKTMRHFHRKLVRSYSIDALAIEGCVTGAADPGGFLKRVSDAPAHVEPAIGLGKDVRLSGPGISGAGLDWQERYAHLCAFSIVGISSEMEGFMSRMSSPRRRFRM